MAKFDRCSLCDYIQLTETISTYDQLGRTERWVRLEDGVPICSECLYWAAVASDGWEKKEEEED